MDFGTIKNRVKQLLGFLPATRSEVARVKQEIAALRDAADLHAHSFKDQFDALERMNATLERHIENLRNEHTTHIRRLTTDLAKLTARETLTREAVIAVSQGDRPPHSFYGTDIFDPESEMLKVLALNLPLKSAIDVGANRGKFSAALLRAGFTVDAFEPLPALANDLRQRFAFDPRIRIHEVACSDRSGSTKLQTLAAEDPSLDTTLFSSLESHPVFSGLTFDTAIQVEMKTLNDALANEGALSVGLLKTDTEGHDVTVLRGADRIQASALLVEFWDKDHVFNGGRVQNTLSDYLSFVNLDEYPYYIVMWRQSEQDAFGLLFKPAQTPQRSWGNILFCKDSVLFDALRTWAQETYGPGCVA